MDRAKHFRSHF